MTIEAGSLAVPLSEFQQRYQDDDACLDFLWRTRFSPDGESAFCPDCTEVRIFRRYDCKSRRRAWSCTACGHYLHPTSGTIFHKSSTPLHLWFLAIYIMIATKHKVSIKLLERELGVTYKTAWRMAHLISRQLLSPGTSPNPGPVEVDVASSSRPGVQEQSVGHAVSSPAA